MTNITFPFPVFDHYIQPQYASNDGNIGNEKYVYITPKYIVAHEVALPVDLPAVNFIDAVNKPNAQSNFHEIADKTGIYRALPIQAGLCAEGWHALGTANAESFGIEIAHYTDPNDFRKAYDIYCARHAYWLLVQGWDITHDKTHHEITLMYPKDGGTHTDPDGYFKQFLGENAIQIYKQDVQNWMIKLSNGAVPSNEKQIDELGKITATTGLHVRATPSSDSTINETLNNGDEIHLDIYVENEGHGWYHTTHGALGGYVWSDYVQLENNNQTSPTPQPNPTPITTPTPVIDTNYHVFSGGKEVYKTTDQNDAYNEGWYIYTYDKSVYFIDRDGNQFTFDKHQDQNPNAIKSQPVPTPTPEPITNPKTPILGNSKVTINQMVSFVKAQNPNFNPAIAQAFLNVSAKYGIRGDIAFCQSIHEANWFKFGGDVKPGQNNFSGIGATGGVAGDSFNTITDGVTAQVQHLFAYCCQNSLPTGESVLDPRFQMVTRCTCQNWEDLGGHWAKPGFDELRFADFNSAYQANATYGQEIVKLYNELLATPDIQQPVLTQPTPTEIGNQAINELIQIGLLDNSTDWKSHLLESAPNWLVFELINKLVNKGKS